MDVLKWLTFGLLRKRYPRPLPPTMPRIGRPFGDADDGKLLAGQMAKLQIPYPLGVSDTQQMHLPFPPRVLLPSPEGKEMPDLDLTAPFEAVLRFYDKLVETCKKEGSAPLERILGTGVSLPFATLPINLYVRRPAYWHQIPEPVELTNLTQSVRKGGGGFVLHALLAMLWDRWSPDIHEDRNYPTKPDGMELGYKEATGQPPEPLRMMPDRVISPKLVIDLDELDSWKMALFLCLPRLLADQLNAKTAEAVERIRQINPGLSLELDQWMSPMGVSIQRHAFMLEIFCWVTSAGVVYSPTAALAGCKTQAELDSLKATIEKRRASPAHRVVLASGERVPEDQVAPFEGPAVKMWSCGSCAEEVATPLILNGMICPSCKKASVWLQVEDRDRQLAQMVERWKQVYGDPNDPAVAKKIEETAEQLRKTG